MRYLNFSGVGGLVEYLKSQWTENATLHIDTATQIGQPSEATTVQSVTYLAVITWLSPERDYIASASELLEQVASSQLIFADQRQEILERVEARLAELRRELRESGFIVEPGIHSFEAPSYLKV